MEKGETQQQTNPKAFLCLLSRRTTQTATKKQLLSPFQPISTESNSANMDDAARIKQLEKQMLEEMSKAKKEHQSDMKKLTEQFDDVAKQVAKYHACRRPDPDEND
ncbi:MAG: hypothetical protein WBA76_08555 [Phormidesmis sp.]